MKIVCNDRSLDTRFSKNDIEKVLSIIRKKSPCDWDKNVQLYSNCDGTWEVVDYDSRETIIKKIKL